MFVTWAGVAEAAKGAADAVPHVVVLDTPGVPHAPSAALRATAGGAGVRAAAPHQSDPGETAVIVGRHDRPAEGRRAQSLPLFMNADTPGRLFGIRDDDVVIVVLPLFHVFGLSSILDVRPVRRR